MDRVFLDANVLFSAAYRADSALVRLWERPGCRLLTSSYAVEEALRNLDDERQRRRLAELLERVNIVEHDPGDFRHDLALPEKDIPILAAAIRAKATHLLSGDRKAFGPWNGKTVEGVLVLRPVGYLMPGVSRR